MKRLIYSAISLAILIVAALWLWGFVGVKAGWIGPMKVGQLNTISKWGANAAGGFGEAAQKALGL